MQSRFRQMARLENTIAVLLERHRHSVARADESARRSAFHASLVKVCNLAFIILYGDPKIDEPLLFAWKRCCQSAAAIREEGPFTRLDHNTPFELFGALVVVDFFLRFVRPDHCGMLDQLNGIFAKAPPWLCWFTHADLDAPIVGFTLPDLSSVSRFERGRATLYRLPPGPFECHRLPDGVDEPLLIEDMPTAAVLQGVPLFDRQVVLGPHARLDRRLEALLGDSRYAI